MSKKTTFQRIVSDIKQIFVPHDEYVCHHYAPYIVQVQPQKKMPHVRFQINKDHCISQRFSCKTSAMNFHFRIFAEIFALRYIDRFCKVRVLNMRNVQRYQEGTTYMTYGGTPRTMTTAKDELRGYETICDKDNRHVYNRTDAAWDNGRGTGANLDENSLVYPPIVFEEHTY